MSEYIIIFPQFSVEFRIDFKILLITFKSRYGLRPGYISELLTPYESEFKKHFLTFIDLLSFVLISCI